MSIVIAKISKTVYMVPQDAKNPELIILVLRDIELYNKWVGGKNDGEM